MMKRSVLIAHPWVENGGSEATAMWAIRALQDDFDVTLVTAGDVDFDFFNEAFGCGVDSTKIQVVQAPRLPGVTHGMKMVAWQHALFHRFCRKMAGDFDVCVSAYNFVPFGRAAIQLVGDFSFSEELRGRLYVQDYQKFVHRPSLLRSAYLGLNRLFATDQSIHCAGDVVLANSEWTADKLRRHCLLDCGILYPPVVIPDYVESSRERNKVGFFYIGRISPEKEIETIISILDQVREMGFPVTLDLAGNRRCSPYEEMITDMASERSWINDMGFLSGDEKEEALLSSSFGIQACRCEAFGIAAAEMASRGCLPLVAAGCGSSEVVPFEELQFTSIDDAAAKIAHLLKSPEATERLRAQAVDGAKQFNSTEFVVNFRGFVDSMVQEEVSTVSSPHHVTHQESCSAVH